jgi:hypothetical protein
VSNSADALREQFKLGWTQASGTGESAFVGKPIDVYVPPGQSRVIALPIIKDTPGLDRIELKGDDEDFDNVVSVIPPGQQRLNVLWLGNDAPEASIAGEIIPTHEFYSYEAMYLDEHGAGLEIPARVDESQMAALRALAVKTFRALDLSGMARVDFFVDKDSGALYVNEVNTIPGFTSISMYPKLWEATGLSYRALVNRLLELAVERHAARRALSTRYAP